jgi:hypothetical protein
MEQAQEDKAREREEGLDEEAAVAGWVVAAEARAENAYVPIAAIECPTGQVLPATRFGVLNAGRR